MVACWIRCRRCRQSGSQWKSQLEDREKKTMRWAIEKFYSDRLLPGLYEATKTERAVRNCAKRWLVHFSFIVMILIRRAFGNLKTPSSLLEEDGRNHFKQKKSKGQARAPTSHLTFSKTMRHRGCACFCRFCSKLWGGARIFFQEVGFAQQQYRLIILSVSEISLYNNNVVCVRLFSDVSALCFLVFLTRPTSRKHFNFHCRTICSSAPAWSLIGISL